MDTVMEILEIIKQFATEKILEPIKGMTIFDYADVALLTVSIFMLILFLKNRRAGKLAIGFLFIIALFVVVNAVELKAMQYILSSFYQIGFIAIIIIFQDDLRAALEKVGGFSDRITRKISGNTPEAEAIIQICNAAGEMSSSMTGALIVIEGETKLGNYSETGTIIDAKVSDLLLRNIFFNRSPLHDGAVIIRNMRIYAAGCKLPLTHKELDASLGTRHRAAVGVSETASDAIVIVVSEETGTISMCHDGEIKRGLSRSKLENELFRLTSALNKNRAVETHKGDDANLKKTRKKLWEEPDKADSDAADGSEDGRE